MKREKFDRSSVDEQKKDGIKESNAEDDDNDCKFQNHQQRFKVTVSYDGTDFCGWQIQNNNNNNKKTSSSSSQQSSIQARIEQRLSSVFLGKPFGVAIAGSGRTDAGVHAKGQVFHFDAPKTIRIPEKQQQEKSKVISASSEKQQEEEDEEEVSTCVNHGDSDCNANQQNQEKKTTKKPTKSAAVIMMKEVEVTREKILQFLSTGLPPSIKVLKVEGPVPFSFHARESCMKKRYEYVICEDQSASPFDTRFCYSLGQMKRTTKLDVGKMQEAAQFLIGRHDFSAFGVIENGDPRDPVKHLESIKIERNIVRRAPAFDDDEDDRDYIENESNEQERNSSSSCVSFVRITAECDRFLWHMMRMISGTLIDVGLGKIESIDVKNLLEGKERGAKHQTAKVRVTTAPAQGLCLVKVFYGEEEQKEKV